MRKIAFSSLFRIQQKFQLSHTDSNQVLYINIVENSKTKVKKNCGDYDDCLMVDFYYRSSYANGDNNECY